MLQPLENVIRHQFLPSLTGRQAISDDERHVMALPVRLGGLGIPNPTEQSTHQHQTSKAISAPLAQLIIQQSATSSPNIPTLQHKAKVHARNTRRRHEMQTAEDLTTQLPAQLQRALIASSEKGASSWLSTLPIAEHGFALHKGAFRDALCLCYGWHPPNLPSNCVCGKSFTVTHALSCPRGGYPTIRHNELRDITAQMLTTTCHGVGTEPTLQPLTGELMSFKGAHLEDGARLDIVADNFWGGNRQRAFCDVRVFNPFAPSHRHTSLPQCYRKNKLEKKRVYEERVREVEHGSFSPLVFSTSGGMGPIANTVYRRIAATTAEKHKQNYSKTLFWLRCKLSFSLLRSAIMCLRGARSSRGKPSGPQDMVEVHNIDLACSEGRIPSAHDLAC